MSGRVWVSRDVAVCTAPAAARLLELLGQLVGDHLLLDLHLPRQVLLLLLELSEALHQPVGDVLLLLLRLLLLRAAGEEGRRVNH